MARRYLSLAHAIYFLALLLLMIFAIDTPLSWSQSQDNGIVTAYSPSLDFPIQGYVPYQATYFSSSTEIAPINSVIDHSLQANNGQPGFYSSDNIVWAFTGEKGEKIYCTEQEKKENGPCSGSQPSYPQKKLKFLFSVQDGQRIDQIVQALNNGTIPNALRAEFSANGITLSDQASVEVIKPNEEWWIIDRERVFILRLENGTLNIYDRQPFIVNGHYLGRPSGPTFLQYEGHPGYDYNLTGKIRAPADGRLIIPKTDPINGNLNTASPWCGLHTFYIDHGNGFTTWYLHSQQLNPALGGPGSTDYCNEPQPDDIVVAYVNRGDYIADVGGWGKGQPDYFGPHLHFEVRKNGIPIDPYGWRSEEQDPLQQWATSVNLWNHPPFQADPSVRWHPDGTLIRVKGGTDVYLIDNGHKRRVTFDSFNNYGFLWHKVIEVEPEELSCFPDALPLENPPRLVRKSDGPQAGRIYQIFNEETKRWVTTPEVLEGLFGAEAWTILADQPSSVIDSFPDDPGAPELYSPFPDGTLLKAYNTDPIYVVTNGKRRHIANPQVFEQLGYNWDEIVRVPQSELDKIPEIAFPITESYISQCAYIEDFEGGIGRWSKVEVGTGSTTIVTSSTSPVHSGQQSVRQYAEAIDSDDVNSYTRLILSAPSNGSEYSIETWIYVKRRTDAFASSFIGFLFPGGSVGWNPWGDNSSYAYYIGGGPFPNYAPVGLPKNSWHYVKVSYYPQDATFSVWVNGSNVHNHIPSGAQVGDFPSSFIITGFIVGRIGDIIEQFVDDVAVSPFGTSSTGNSPATFRVDSQGNVFSDQAFFCGLSSTTNSPGQPCFNAGIAADIAERINVSEPVEPGDVVEIDPTQPRHYRKARGPYSTLVAGVIVAGSGFVLANLPEELKLIELFNGIQTPKPVLSPLIPIFDINTIPKWSIASLARAQGQGTLRQPEMRVSVKQLLQWKQPSMLGRPLLALMGRVKVKAATENGPIQPGDLLVSSSIPGYVMRCADPQGCEGAIVGKALEPLEEGTGMILMLVMR